MARSRVCESRMRLSKKLGLIFAASVIVVVATFRYLFFVPAVAPPTLRGGTQRAELNIAGFQRQFSYYMPHELKPGAPVVIIFHGSRGTGERIQLATAFAFDALADKHGFIVAYPDAYERHWNDCRAVGAYAAKELAVDDVGFVRSLLTYLQAEHGADPARVLSVGLSGGGQMSLRLALEAPELIRSAVAIAANMPAPNNIVCKPEEKVVAVMFINGTDDALNPFEGGEVGWLGLFGRRGTVLSALQSAQYWARLAGHESGPFQHRFPDSAAADNSVATRMVWANSGLAEVSLITVHGGGHTIPNPKQIFPRFLGPTNRDFSAADEIWRFFLRELDRPK